MILNRERSLLVAARHEAASPGGRRIRVAQAAERIDQPGEARPSKPSQPAILESADDRLIDTAQEFELPLRDREPVAAAAHQASD